MKKLELKTNPKRTATMSTKNIIGKSVISERDKKAPPQRTKTSQNIKTGKVGAKQSKEPEKIAEIKEEEISVNSVSVMS